MIELQKKTDYFELLFSSIETPQFGAPFANTRQSLFIPFRWPQNIILLGHLLALVPKSASAPCYHRIRLPSNH